jgi:hypothetical protein
MKRIGDVLLGLGLLVGIGAIVGYEMDIIPTLPPAVLKLVLYKLIFVGGVGLLVAGAFVRRLAGRIEQSNSPSGIDHGISKANRQAELPSPQGFDQGIVDPARPERESIK